MDLVEKMQGLSSRPITSEDRPLSDREKEDRAIAAMNQSIEAQAQWATELENKRFAPVKQQVIDVAKTWTSTVLGAPADLLAVGMALGYNAVNVARGGSFNWPKSFKDVPATGDWYADKMGVDVESNDYIMGSIISPSLPAGKGALFFGLTAKGLDPERVKTFNQLEKQGLSPEDIWQQTLLYRGKDKQIKFAISDADMKVAEIGDLVSRKTGKEIAALQKAPVGKSVPVTFRLDEVIQHDALFEAYPQLASYKVVLAVEKYDSSIGTGYRVFNSEAGKNIASFAPDKKAGSSTITLNSGYDAKRSLVHEIQHAIQEIEGFSFGANSAPYLNALDMAREAQQSIRITNRIVENASMSNEDIMKLMLKEGFTKDQISANLPMFKKVRNAIDEGDMSVIDDTIYWYRLAEDKSYNLLGAMLAQVSPDNIENFSEAARKMSVFELEALIQERYLRQGGEVEARLAETLANIRQEQLDKLSITPEQLLDAIDPKTGKLNQIAEKVGVRTSEMVVE